MGVHWIERFLRFHAAGGSWRHPNDMGGREVEAFLTDLAGRGRVSASTQNQALNAIIFLYRHVLDRDLGELKATASLRRR